jgi:hypothetical protein
MAFLLACLIFAQDPAPGLYDVDKVEMGDKFKGSPDARTLLGRNGFVVTDETFKQIFEPYVFSAVPKFITADSAWQAYHVLLEEGVRQMARDEAETLRKLSTRLLALSASSQDPLDRDLARYAAVGLAFQDASAVDPALRTEAKALVEAIEGGSGPVRALFFGLPLLPERFRPAGFYASDAALRSYFRARQWYAICDFRAKSVPEIARAARLATRIEGDPELAALYARLTEPYDTLVGPVEDGDVKRLVGIAGKAASPEELSRAAVAAFPAPRVNDQVLDPAAYANFAEEIRGFRLLPPRALSSGILFQSTVDPVVKGRMFPSGIDLAAAGPLASDAGKKALHREFPDAAEAVLRAPAAKLGESLHDRALKALAQLQEKLPATAPAACRTTAWTDLQVWTQLGAWAELQHTWALQAKMNVHYMGVTEPYPGVVAPTPTFFRELAALARDTATALRRNAPADTVDLKQAGTKLRNLLAAMGRLEKKETEVKDFMLLEESMEFINAVVGKAQINNPEEVTKRLKELEPLAQRCLDGKAPTPEETRLLRMLAGSHDVPALLAEFAPFCELLARLAAKTRDGLPPGPEDQGFIRDYGSKLARFHFYDGNSYLTPRDDFPKVTPVFFSPAKNEILYAGVARPQSLYVIIEVGGKPVLHRGAVLSYRELRRPADQVLVDEAWREEVKAGKAPPPPGFTESFRR